MTYKNTFNKRFTALFSVAVLLLSSCSANNTVTTAESSAPENQTSAGSTAAPKETAADSPASSSASETKAAETSVTSSAASPQTTEAAGGSNAPTENLSADSGVFEGRQQTSDYNYGEALQKSIMFYDLQRTGDLPDNFRCNWRGDSCLKDGSEVGLDLSGGFLDAGDNAKFNLPMSYTTAVLAWSVIEDRASYEESGQLSYILDNIRWGNDYFIKCHPEPDIYYYQVGDGNADHSWWGAAECVETQMKRPCYKVDLNNGGSTVAAGTAASLASCAVVFKDSDPA